MRREALGNRHPHTLNSIHNLGVLLRAKGDIAAAEPLLREALEGRRASLSSGHPATLVSIRNLRALLIFRWLNTIKGLLSLDIMLLIRWLGSTYTYIASSCRSPSLGSI